MNYIITDVDLNERFQKLKLDVPQQLTFLPENVDSAEMACDFIFPDTLTELKKTLRLQQINIPLLGDAKAQLHGRKSADLYLPALFVGGAALLANPHLISVALNVISNYVYDFFKGNPGKKIVAFEIFIEKERDKTTKKITFKGPPEGVKDLANVIKQLDK